LLASLRDAPEDREPVVGLQRDLHTLKGGARMAGLAPIGDLSHSPEEASERRIDRVALHAVHLGFTHPRSGKFLIIDAKPPADFQSLVGGLSLAARHTR